MTNQKQTVVSFRVDQHLAEILNALPDKSAFIREAILHRFYTVCPICRGRGVLPQIIADWLQDKIPVYDAAECSCCHYAYPTDLVRPQLENTGTNGFVCQHCVEHNHSH